jgi:two-component system response regulator YesN
MYKLLIVDDECMITDLLYENLLQRMDDNLEIQKAYTGHDAAAIIAQEPVDILLTDINMPGISGLELHEKAIRANADCKVIFLSGYGDFNNIQYALRNESVDFILKTESNEVIYRSVEKALKALDDKHNAAALKLKAEEQLRRTLPMLQERLILSLLSGGPFNETDFQETEMPLCAGEPVLLLMGHVDDDHVSSWIEFYQLKHIADECLAQDHCVFSVIEGKDLLWLIQPRIYDPAATFDKARSSVDVIQRLCLEISHVSVSMALAENFVPFREISQAWNGLKQSLYDLYGLSRGMQLIVNPIRLMPDGAKKEWLQIRRVLNHLEICVSSFQGDIFHRYFSELDGLVRDNPRLSFEEKSEIAVRLYLAFLMKHNDEAETDSPFFSFAGGLNEDWPQFKQRITALAEAYFARRERDRFFHTKVLGRLANYISNNLGGDLSLNKLTEIAYFSPTYLSRLFKQVTNVSLTDYIGRLKYEKAVQLLINSDMKVVKIAEMLGFETQSYFTRFFKKHAEMGPQEYRETFTAKKDNNNIKR